MRRLGECAHENVCRLEIAMDEAEIMQERERAQRLRGERHERAGPSRRTVATKFSPSTCSIVNCERPVSGSTCSSNDLDEIRMTQRRERRELAVQSGGLIGAGFEKLLQREARVRACRRSSTRTTRPAPPTPSAPSTREPTPSPRPH